MSRTHALLSSHLWRRRDDARAEADTLVENVLYPGLHYLEKVLDHPANGTELLSSPWIEWLWRAFGTVIVYRRHRRRSRHANAACGADTPTPPSHRQHDKEGEALEGGEGSHRVSTRVARRPAYACHFPESVTRQVTLLFRHVVRRMTVLDMAANPWATVILRLKSLPQESEVLQIVSEEVCRHFLHRGGDGAAELKHNMQKAQRMMKNMDLLFRDLLPTANGGGGGAGSSSLYGSGGGGGGPSHGPRLPFDTSLGMGTTSATRRQTRTASSGGKKDVEGTAEARRRLTVDAVSESSASDLYHRNAPPPQTPWHTTSPVASRWEEEGGYFTLRLGAEVVSAINTITVHNGSTLRRFMKNETSLFLLRDNIAYYLLLHIPSFYRADVRLLGKMLEVCANDERITMVLLWRLVQAVWARDTEEVQSVVYFLRQWVCLSMEGWQVVMRTLGPEGHTLGLLLCAEDTGHLRTSLPPSGRDEGVLERGERDWKAPWTSVAASSSSSSTMTGWMSTSSTYLSLSSAPPHASVPTGSLLFGSGIDETKRVQGTARGSLLDASDHSLSSTGPPHHAAPSASSASFFPNYAHSTIRVIEWCRQHARLWSCIANRIQRRAAETIKAGGQEVDHFARSSASSSHPPPHRLEGHTTSMVDSPYEEGRASRPWQASVTNFSAVGEEGRGERGRIGMGPGGTDGVTEVRPTGLSANSVRPPSSEWEHRLQKAREKHYLHRRETQRVVLQEWNALCDSVNALLLLAVDETPVIPRTTKKGTSHRRGERGGRRKEKGKVT